MDLFLAAVIQLTSTADVEANWQSVRILICYDLRFPELYRQLAAEGAEILAVPATFAGPTGRDHWQHLLRARAIKNQRFVITPG